MIRLGEDGSCSYSLGNESQISRSVRISSEGLLYIGTSNSQGFNGMGALFAGSSFLVSDFQNNCPSGKSIRLTGGDLIEENYFERKRVSTWMLNPDDACEYLQEYYEFHHPDGISLNVFQSIFDLRRKEGSWEELVPSCYWVRSVTSTAEIGNTMTGYVGTSLVFLTPLASDPPKGFTQIMQGVAPTRNKDIWLRRFERLVIWDSGYPPNVLRPIGLYRIDDTSYVVSISSELIESDELVDETFEPLSIDSIFDRIHSMVESIQFVHSVGVTFNGTISRKLFIHTESGKAFLNTGHLLAQDVDESALLGGFTGDDLRFVSFNRIQNHLSIPMKAVRKYLNIEDDLKLTSIEDDTASVGLLIAALVNGNLYPFPWLTHSQYILLSLTDSKSDWLSLLCKEPVNLEVLPELKDLTDMSPANKLAYKLIKREMTLVQVIEAIERYREWRDELDGASVETEMKAMFSKVSSIFQTSQERIKESLIRNDFW